MSKDVNSKWFATVGGLMSFRLKIQKHINSRNADKLRDYVCMFFDHHEPKNGSLSSFLSKTVAKEIIEVLKAGGYTPTFMVWKNDGVQFVLYHKATDSYYRSKFAW